MMIELPDDDMPAGSVGQLVTFDLTPRANPARARPFIFSVLLLRGAVRASEVIDSMAPHVHPDDLRSWDVEATQLELVVTHAIQGLIKKRVLREHSHIPGVYVLDNTPEAARRAITATSALDAQLPDHLLQEVGRQHYTPDLHV